jgi:hypothetical protein
VTDADQAAAPPATEPSAPRSRWSAGRVIGMVFASIGGLIGLALLLGGIAVLAAYAFARDDDGYFTSDSERLASTSYAITTEDIDLGADETDWAPDGILGNVRVQVEGDEPVFVGIGPDGDVDTEAGPSSTPGRAGRPRLRPANRTSGSPSQRGRASSR